MRPNTTATTRSPLSVGTLEKSDRKITLVTLGALTNIALVLQKRPDLFGKTEKLCIMGGAFSMILGEYNFSWRSRTPPRS